jgi:hypothetical protein
VSDLNNKHLPSDIDSLTRKDLVEIYHIHVEEMQTAQKRIADLEDKLQMASLLCKPESLKVHNLKQKAQACFELASEGGEDKKLTYIPLREINNFGVNYSKQAKQLKGGAK